MTGKTVLVGVSGGISAYKTADVVSRLRQEGVRVIVIMTRAAAAFVSPLTFETLSGNPVYEDILARPRQWQVEHIALAEQADLLLVAPATANVIGKLANGIADDYVTTLYLALDCPVILVPAMNHRMYASPQVRDNLARLAALPRHHILEPATGRLASGAYGQGRLPEPPEIVEAVKRVLSVRRDLEGITMLVTAGPTREPVDPVRFLSNPSTGKMGFALARAARDRGAVVTLVTGPTHLPPPSGVHVIKVERAEQMREEVLRVFPEVDVVIKAAAVADYRPARFVPKKIKKGPETLEFTLVKNPDILAELGRMKGRQVLVGFAAETTNGMENAREKLVQKNLDLIVLNDVGQQDSGFASDTNAVKLLGPDGIVAEISLRPKDEVAHEILDHVAKLVVKRS